MKILGGKEAPPADPHVVSTEISLATEPEFRSLAEFAVEFSNFALTDDPFSEAVKKIIATDIALSSTSGPVICLETAILFQNLVVLVDAEIKKGDTSKWHHEIAGIDSNISQSVRALLPGLLERSSVAVQKGNQKILDDDSAPSVVFPKLLAMFPTLKPFFESTGIPKITDSKLTCTRLPFYLVIFNSF